MKNLLAPVNFGAAALPFVKSLYGKNISPISLCCAKETKGMQVKQKISFKQGRKYYIKERKGIKFTDELTIIKIFIKMQKIYPVASNANEHPAYI